MRKPRRRAMIVSAARPIFAQKGFHTTTIDDICKACGISHGTLYLHFKNKDEIFHSLMVDTLDRIQELMRPIGYDDPRLSIVAGNEFFEFIRQRNLHIFEVVNEDRDLFRIILREAPGLAPEIDAILSRINSVMLGQIEAEIALGQRLGMIRETDARLVAQMIMGTMLMVILTHFTEGEPPDLESLAQQVTELQFFGIQKPSE